MYRVVSVLALCALFAHVNGAIGGEKECMQQSGFYLPALIQYVDSDGNVDRRVKCYVSCLGVLNNYFLRDRRLQPMIATFQEWKLDSIYKDPFIADLKNCSNASDSLGTADMCELGFFNFMCYHQAKMKLRIKLKSKKVAT